MANGTVTITAKVNAPDAERRLQVIAQREREIGVEAARAGTIQAQSAKAAADQYDKLSVSQRELSQQSRVAAGDVVKLSTNLSMLGLAAIEAKQNVGLVGTGVKALGLVKGPVGLIAGLGALAIAAKTASDGMEYLSEVAIPAAGRAEASLASLRIVTERTGGDVAATTRHVEGLEDALTGLTSAAQATRTFNTMGLSLERQTQLIDAMRDGIVAMGGDVNTQLPLMALAIKRQEGELLDNMGVVSTVEMMYQEYAKTIGTTSDKLSQHQREEAVIQGVLRETVKYTGAASTAMKTYEGRVSALATEKQKLAKDIGDVFLPLSNLTVAVETLGVKLQRRLLDPLKEVRGYLGQSFNETAVLLGGGTLPDEGADAATIKTIKKLQALNAVERARQAQAAGEGGYGPANIVDINKFHEERAKREQAAQERATAKAKQDAERRKREAEQHAEQVARVNEQLNDRLAQLTMGRFDYERLQAQKAFEEEVRLGANRETAAKVLSAKLKAIAADLHASDTKRLTEQAGRIGASNVMGPFLPGQEQAVISVGDDTPAARQARRMESEIGQYVRDFNTAADEAAKKQLEAHRKGADLVGSAISESGALLANSIRSGGAPSAGGSVSTAANLAATGLAAGAGVATGTVVGIPLAVVLAVAAAGVKVAGDVAAAYFDRSDAEIAKRALQERADADFKAANAARKFSEAVSKAADASREHLDKQQRVFSLIEDYKRTTDPDYDKKRADQALDWVNSRRMGTGAGALTLDQAREKVLGEGLEQDFLGRGDTASAVQSKDAEAILLEYFIRQAQQKDDKDRIQPGSTPDRPLYSSIVNFKDMMAFFAPGELFRAQGPGTRRGDGMKGRAVNTRAV